MNIEFNFDAFISYRRGDGAFIGKWLRHYLTRYKLPTTLRKENAKPVRIYLDTSHGIGTFDFYNENIKPSIQESRHLIFVVTPSTKESNPDKPNWSIQELTDFQEMPQKRNLMLVLAKGDYEDIPGVIFKMYPNIEIIDIRKNFTALGFLRRLTYQSETLKIIARLHDIQIKDMPLLREEDKIRKRNFAARLGAFAFALLLSVSLIIFKVISSSEAVKRQALNTFERNAIALVKNRVDLDDISGNSEAESSLLGHTCPILDSLIIYKKDDSLFYFCGLCHAYVADVMTQNYDYKNADASIKKSLNLIRSALLISPENPRYKLTLKSMFYRKSKIFRYVREYDSSEYYLQLAMNTQVNSDSLEDAWANRSKSIYTNHFARLERERGNIAKSDSLFNLARHYSSRAYQIRPEREISFTDDYRSATLDWVDVLNRKKLKDSAKYWINVALVASRKIEKKYPLNKRTIEMMASMYRAVSSAFDDMGELTLAKTFSDSAYMKYIFLLNIDPNSRTALDGAAKISRLRSVIFFKLEDEQSGMMESQMEINLRKRILDNFITSTDEQVRLSEAYQIYASYLANRGDRTEALKLLREGIANVKKPLIDSINFSPWILSYMRMKIVYAIVLREDKQNDKLLYEADKISSTLDSLGKLTAFKDNSDLEAMAKTVASLKQSGYQVLSKAERLIKNGNYLLNEKKPKAAAEKFIQATEDHNAKPKAYRGLCKALTDLGDKANSIKCCITALNLDSTSSTEFLNLGYAYLRSSDTTRAVMYWKKALQHKNEDDAHMVAFNNLGFYYLDNHDFKKAISYYNQALAINKNYLDALDGLQSALVKTGMNEQALSIQKRIVKNDPSDVSYYHLGLAYEKVLKNDSAIVAYRKTIALNKNFERARKRIDELTGNKAWQLVDQGRRLIYDNDLNGALEKYLAAIKIRGDYPIAYIGASHCYLNLGQLNKSKEYATSAIKLDSTLSYAYVKIAWAYYLGKDTANAVVNWKNALRYPNADDSHLVCYRNLGLYYQGKRDFKAAIRYYAYALQIEPDHVGTLVPMNYCLWYASKYKEELPVLEALKKKDPANPAYPFYVGNVYEKLANVDSAISYYNKALTLDPKYTEAKKRIDALNNRK